MKEELKQRREEMRFGIASFALSIQLSLPPDQDDSESLYEKARPSFGNDLQRLTEVFLRVRTFGMGHYWGWSWWDTVADGRVHAYDPFLKLDVFYVVESLRIIASLTDDEVKRLTLPYNRDFVRLISSKGKIRCAVDDIVAEPTKWQRILNTKAFSEAQTLFLIYDRTIEVHRKDEEEQLIHATPSPSKITQFEEDVLEEFNKSASLRNILTSEYGGYQDLTTEQVDTASEAWGINKIDDKAAFLDDWPVSYDDWGRGYGRNLGASETELIFSVLVGAIPEFAQPNEARDLRVTIESAIDTLRRRKMEPNVIVSSLHFFPEEMGSRRFFLPNGDPKCPKVNVPGFAGVFGKLKIPLFQIHTGRERKVIGILDTKRATRLTQYSAQLKEEDVQYQNGVLYIRVADLNKDDEVRQDILTQSPDWLEKQQDKERYLRQKVFVRIFEKFKFEVLEPEAGFIIWPK